MRAPLLLFKASAGVLALATLAACATKHDESVSQVAAALSEPAPPMPSSEAPSAMPTPTPTSTSTLPPPLVENFNELPPDRVFFEYDKADLGPLAMAALQRQAAWLQMYPAATLVIEGHSDERGTREYNLALGARRATAVRIFLMTSGVSGARLETVSYGKERPSCIASGEECWHQNRRAVSLIKSSP